ncbi:MAG: carboxypeptidase-like regulatory domain-containing protein [Flavobacteriaceae bacterium]|nr:carboxypeptidase-like regulatory domain-containing protein [Flavobacteriaceae bacterium]
MRNSLKYFFLLVMSLCSMSAFAQIEVKNKISDFLTFQPIESASVYVQNSTIGTVSNVDGKFVLLVPVEHKNDTLVISSIGYKSYKALVSEFDNSEEIFLEEDIASLDEVVIVSDPRPTDGNGIVVRAIERLERNMPNQPYLQKGFLRHRERNKKEYKWLIESAFTLYDSSFASGSRKNLKINIDENRKSYDLRDVDSLFAYASYLRYNGGDKKLRSRNLRRDTIKTSSLVKAIKWNDGRLTGIDNLFKGQLNIIRNSNTRDALFGKDILEKHQFVLDTILVDDGRKLYKIKITKSTNFVGLNTENIYNEGFEARGWIYIYYDNYSVKKLEYELVAASDVQKRRSKSLFDTNVNHKLTITYREFNGKMYPSYVYYETPKLVNIGDRSSDREKNEEEQGIDKDEQYYYTIQEILFSEVIEDTEVIQSELKKKWSSDIFAIRPYNESFWKNYNVLLESEEEGKLIRDLSKKASLFKE